MLDNLQYKHSIDNGQDRIVAQHNRLKLFNWGPIIL